MSESKNLSSLNLSVRVYNSLRRSGISTIEELVVKTEKDLLKLRNFGALSLSEVKESLAKEGLKLKQMPKEKQLTPKRILDEYEQAERNNERRNGHLLRIFAAELKEAGLAKKTIKNHIFNVKVYINSYLTRYDIEPVETGTRHIGGYLGDYFIRKCMWSSPDTIRSTAASIKKFYKMLLRRNKIDQSNYDYLTNYIKHEIGYWQRDCKNYWRNIL
ncbi:MAG: phage integrase N-terminal SAM-like domain-containing protein [Anaerolineaceae bacterium]|nr:phage integrase N-terminal SAM-like domain-containing protein [Anaerolineaceae bacterium]